MTFGLIITLAYFGVDTFPLDLVKCVACLLLATVFPHCGSPIFTSVQDLRTSPKESVNKIGSA